MDHYKKKKKQKKDNIPLYVIYSLHIHITSLEHLFSSLFSSSYFAYLKDDIKPFKYDSFSLVKYRISFTYC